MHYFTKGERLLWVLAAQKDASYIPVIVCFVMFLFNDLYGFISWRRMARRQKEMA